MKTQEVSERFVVALEDALLRANLSEAMSVYGKRSALLLTADALAAVNDSGGANVDVAMTGQIMHIPESEWSWLSIRTRPESRELHEFVEVRAIPWSEFGMAAAKDRSRRITTEHLDRFWKLRTMSIDSRGRMAARKELFVGANDSVFRIIDPGEAVLADGLLTNKWDASVVRTADTAAGAYLLRNTYWHCDVGIGSQGIRVIVPTDPTGVKCLWALRDVPNGRTRRDALLHWVGSHYRRLRTDPDIETYVREHMRGATALECGDLNATITPSTEDVKRSVDASERRQAMRTSSLDRRRRELKKRMQLR